ncbi:MULTISPECIES: LCP family protein [Arthrobacter]|uniref:LCP family protein n=2 Tax=Arthrobacter TaxID=1663 RepID=A0ABU9KLR1_9MICC|nr:LCP family protein [Arthrobacter sp. YJM1]MDP5227742.1 LCP family protein [Arthrobacter sp. YJM1]
MSEQNDAPGVDDEGTDTSAPAADPDASRHRRERKRRKRAGLIVLLSCLCLVLVAGVAAGGYVWYLFHSFDTKTTKVENAFPKEATRPKAVTNAEGKAAYNLLLVGSDSRTASSAVAEEGGASDQRSDTMMLVHIPADRSNVYVISIMRDTWVDIPGHGQAKINAAFAYGGTPLMVQTVESVLHQRIDHVAFVNFDGFQSLTDAVGGVDVNIPISFKSTFKEELGFQYTQGPMHLNGEQAMWFVRERHAFPDGDYQRVRDQQIFLKALLGKIATPSTLANPVTLAKAVDQFSPYVTIDSTFTADKIVALALEVKGIKPSQAVTFTLPTLGTGWSPDGQQSIVILDTAKADSLSKAMTAGTMAQWVDTNKVRFGN